MKNSARFRNRSRRSRGRKRLTVLALLVLVLAVVAIVLLHRRAGTAQPIMPQAVRATPARVGVRPTSAWTMAQRNALRRAVGAAIEPGTNGATRWSCVVLSQGGKTLYNNRASASAMPASALKLIVAATALNDLGPAYRFHTLFAASDRPAGDRIDGNLWLIGSGDPSLRSPALRGGVKLLAQQGVRRIAGSIVVDASAIEGEEINPLWNADDANEDFEAATSGISLDEDTVEFRITGNAPGTPARVAIYPQSRAVHYSGWIVTSGAGGDDVVIAATQTANEFTVSGAIPPGVTEKFWVPVHGIPQYVGAAVARMFGVRGISTGAPPRTGTAPLRALVLWDHRSAPLRDVLHDMLFHSDNHYAEQLMRVVGGLDGAAANDAHGLAAERNFLHASSIPTPGLHTVDGSGLAHANRVAAVTLATLLSYEQDDPLGNPLYLLLPRGGFDGTLEHYRFTSALGRVRAKSGHIFGASSLAGYVNTRHHGRLSFAFIINGSPGDPDASIVAAIDRLSEF